MNQLFTHGDISDNNDMGFFQSVSNLSQGQEMKYTSNEKNK